MKYTKEIKKVCNMCQKVHTQIPDNARPDFQEGVLIATLWECDCKSTMYQLMISKDEIKAILRGAA